MNYETISYAASDECPSCSSTNWVIDQGDGHLLHGERPTKRNDRACNDCGEVWESASGMPPRAGM